MMCAGSAVMLVNYLYCYRQREESLTGSLDQKTVLPRLVNLLEENYKEAKSFKKRQTVKNFDTFCLGVLRTHIGKLDRLSDEEIREEIIKAEGNRLIGKYVKKVEESLFTEIKNRRLEQ